MLPLSSGSLMPTRRMFRVVALAALRESKPADWRDVVRRLTMT